MVVSGFSGEFGERVFAFRFSGSSTGASPGDQQGAHKGRRPRQELSEGLRKVWAEECGGHNGSELSPAEKFLLLAEA